MASAWKSLTTGARIRRAHTLFWWAVAFPIMFVCLAYTAATVYLAARSLLDDHSIAQATVTYDLDAPPSDNLTRFKYDFSVDGKDYTGTFSSLKSREDEVGIGSSMQIAYANADPARSQRLELLRSNADLRSSVVSLLTMTALGALLIGIFYCVLAWLLGRLTANMD